MSVSKCLMTAAFVGVVFAGPACTDKAMDEAKKDAGSALDATKARVDMAIDATKKAGDETAAVTKDVAQRTAAKTKELAGEVAQKSKEVASATGAAVTDGWITAKVKAKFADETVLKGSHINVDTGDHVVTLSGTVPSGAAKARAAVIADGDEEVPGGRQRADEVAHPVGPGRAVLAGERAGVTSVFVLRDFGGATGRNCSKLNSGPNPGLRNVDFTVVRVCRREPRIMSPNCNSGGPRCCASLCVCWQAWGSPLSSL